MLVTEAMLDNESTFKNIRVVVVEMSMPSAGVCGCDALRSALGLMLPIAHRLFHQCALSQCIFI